MKKITFLLMMLLSITAFSQVEVVENFDNNQIPTGWTSSGFSANALVACGGTGSGVFANLFGGTQGSLTSPDYLAISNGTNLTASFSFNVFAVAGPGSFSAPPADWGTITMEYSTDNGANWTTITTVDDADFTFVDNTTCTSTGDIAVGAIADGSDFQVRIVADNAASSPRLVYAIDNVSLTQVPDSAPNCDVVLTTPLNGSDTADIDVVLTWNAATGFPDGYTVSVGTTSGGTDIVNADTTTETNYSLDGLGLNYETEYFVNIVPYNGFGSATGCTEESFTTRVAPVVGAACSNPHVVGAFPYIVASDDTANYENNVNSGSCGSNDSSYMLGNDVFYSITPTTDVSINIDLTSISNNGAGMHLMKGCPTDVDKECLAFEGTFSTTGGSLNISEAVLLAGETYFLVLSNSSSSRTYTYSLIITQNDCINPDFTLSTTQDCGNGEFYVDVDVTYMGDASSLTISDNFGNTGGGINATGVYAGYGPYTSGSTVEITLTNNNDNSCFYTDSIYFFCPPVNDECANSIALTVNTDGTCTNVLAASNAGATESVSDPLTCGNNTNDVWFSFVAASETMILEYLNVTEAIGSGGTLQATELLEGTCGTLTSLSCNTGSYVAFGGLTIGNTYYIRNSTNLAGEYAQNYDICIRTLPAAPVNNDCSNATVLTASADNTCGSAVAGTTIGATTSTDNTCTSVSSDYSDVWYVFNPGNTGYYEFTLERLSTTPSTYYSVFSGSCGSLVEKSTSCTSNGDQIYFMDNSETYYVQVRSALIGPGIDFNLCVYQLPDGVANSECSTSVTILESADSNGNNSISGNINVTDVAYYSPEGCASSSTESVWYNFTPQYTGLYNFNFTRVSGSASYTVYNTDDCSQTETAGYVTGLVSCFNSTTPRTGELVAGNTYLVMIHASSAAEYEFFVYPDPSLSVESSVFETFKYYPNPVVSTFTVEAKDAISKITVHNIVGQQVQVITPNSFKSTINMNTLKKGVYFVTVSINDAQKTIRVIKN